MGKKNKSGARKKKNGGGNASSKPPTSAQIAKTAKAIVAKKIAVATSGTSGGVLKYVKGIMNPSSFPGMRLATINDCNPTSVVDLHLNVQVNTSSYVGNYPVNPAGSSNVFLFRDPLRCLVYLLPNVPPFSYSAVFYTGTGTGSSKTLGTQSIGYETALVPIYFTQSTGASPHGATLFCGKNEEQSGYVWMDVGATMTAFESVASTSTDVLRVYACTPDGEVLAASSNFVGTSTATCGFTVSGNQTSNYVDKCGGYFRFTIVNVGTTSKTVTLTLSTTVNSDVFCHISPANAVSHLNQLTQARTNGVSLLLSNGAANQYNDGFLEAVNVGPGSLWNSYIGQNNLTGFASDSNYFSGVFKKGLYTYLKPADQEDVEFYPYAAVDALTGAVTSCAFPLFRSRYAVVRLQGNPYGTSSPAVYSGLEYLLTQSMIVEFQTNDMWFDADIPPVSTEDVNRARDFLRRVPYFFENPTHLQNIANAIRGTGQFLRKHIGKIGGALGFLFPQFAPAFNAISGALK